MDSMRSLNTSLPASAAHKQNTQNDSPEQLLDAFKAAALSVTKLYKTSAASQAKARADGYQDCLDDLLAFLDKENIGVDDGEGWRIRKWATERLDNRDSPAHTAESEDEAEKAETASSPELNRTNSSSALATTRGNMGRTDSAPPPSHAPMSEPAPVIVPSQDTFTFQSSHPWPPQQPDAYMNIANLDLSDSRAHDNNNTAMTTTTTTTTNGRPRPRPQRPGARQGNVARVAGSKRKINFAEIFDLGSLNDKNVFGGGGNGGGKRSRHT
ncbi:hypothetical protein B0T11DRAFT_271844 [Plectosphaerella cucumerina]|uniref:Uncharacterized protein n=1 Tax=Plectosphaerella cucumerina TaxID=40658 RepID=A0A8K0TVQ5_9PEZI|nr:hypothetical protein B0T11DRAFT_271844 [Plectosphaerella cucumerina]